ncbi:separin protein [Saxophila tyrrhenica]|uniref:separase n=1 Tax=Saxophila tyrrhenica TaxID=1690608 RepID=A0AAV9PDK5_9PEZI|nr:separin protein [Saxophila tyrrhenica]
MGASTIPECVRKDFEAGTASTRSVATLQTLLGLVDATPGAATRDPIGPRAGSKTDTIPVRNGRAPPGKPKPARPVPASEERTKGLSGREKYALATETINTCLKLLNDTLRSSKAAAESKHSVKAFQSPASRPKKPLQPVSGNITPAPSPPKRRKASEASIAQIASPAEVDRKENARALANCARLSTAYLRSVDTKALGVRPLPKFQMESGMLALSNSLVGLGMYDLAVNELSLVKRSLEHTQRPPGGKVDVKVAETAKQPLVSLLQLALPNDALLEDDAISLALSYYQTALKLLSSQRRPRGIERIPEYLSLEGPNGYIAVLRRQSTLDGNATKVNKSLENIASVLLGICPSVASAGDEAAVDVRASPSPEAVFKVQTLALQIRAIVLNSSGQYNEVERELIGPLAKCMTAFARRFRGDAVTASDVMVESYKKITSGLPTRTGLPLYSIHSQLYHHADKAELYEDALQWAEQLANDCQELEANHARHIAAVAGKAAIEAHLRLPDARISMEKAARLLAGKINGGSREYETLVRSLARLTLLRSAPLCSQQLLAAAARFAQRYARSYPDSCIHDLQSIMDSALRSSKTSDDMLSWISLDAATIYIQAGVLRAVATCATERPLAEAWSVDAAAISLSRVLRGLVLKSVRSDGDIKKIPGINEDVLEPAQRGAMLEWQLHYAVELASRTKYHHALRKLLPDLLRVLSSVYDVSTYPIRRARVVFVVLGLHECHQSLLSEQVRQSWCENVPSDLSQLGEDAGLEPYAHDIVARSQVAQLFSKGRPTFEELNPALQSWQNIVDRRADGRAVSGMVDDPVSLQEQLRSIAAYFRMLGDDAATLAVLQLLVRLHRLTSTGSAVSVSSCVELAEQWLRLGYSEHAGSVLAQSETRLQDLKEANLERLHHRLAHAEHLQAMADTEKCATVLDEARSLRKELPPARISTEQSRAFESLHAQAWLVQSKNCLAAGSLHDALAAAKQSVRVLNSVWSSLERMEDGPRQHHRPEAPEPSEASMDGLAQGVSKLDLKAAATKKKQSSVSNLRGAAFWPIVPLIVRSLQHLSDMYAHHGLFIEADHYSERAVSITKSMGSNTLLSRAQSHRSQLLTLAGQLEQAELCLEMNDTSSADQVSLGQVERLCAKATLRRKEGSLEVAFDLYEQAEQVLQKLQSDSHIRELESCLDPSTNGVEHQFQSLALADEKQHGRTDPSSNAHAKGNHGRKIVKQPASATKNAKAPRKACANPQTAAVVMAAHRSPISKLQKLALNNKALVALQLGRGVESKDSWSSSPGLEQSGRVRHQILFRSALDNLDMDVTLNILQESTLSIPTGKIVAGNTNAVSAPRPKQPAQAKANATVKSSRSARPIEEPLDVTSSSIACLLDAARSCLLEELSLSYHLSSTAQTHADFSSLSSVTLLESAISTNQSGDAFQSIQQALHIDVPRVKALQYEQGAVEIERGESKTSDPLAWPKQLCLGAPGQVTAQEFQAEYIDIIPSSWTVVSLCLSEDCSELYAARYHSKQTPLVLKLPFSRHKPDDVDDDAFDFEQGRSELQEIIDLSNYSCNNPGKLDAKGAKTKWWNQRETLDKRLHELLINMENIWFGGFKGLFSQHRSQQDLLERFRKSFDQLLAKHLPSRQSKPRAQYMALDDQILELFIGLGHDDGTIDLEEPLADLLYFVVDLLQFQGERNAYDEIDFDSMVVEVLDTLRAYHEASNSQSETSPHLVLVLDRRLQAFPWESMPCLQESSVSRVGSMLSLRQSLLAMRARREAKAMQGETQDCYVVERKSGTYILNPSSDLTGTQATLQPALASLSEKGDSSWKAIVNEEPSEQTFSSALMESSMLLYFGHGAGSQYIRPRTIKRLDRCSEVVWLMGCSSGTVQEYGDLEPSAVPLSYLLAGGCTDDSEDIPSRCVAVVATLWDVTDKDIDRFSLAMGEVWGLWPASEQAKLPAKTPRKRQILAAPYTPDQVPKTPKTPKVRKTPAPAKTPARSQSRLRKGGSGKCSLVEAVARSRESCYLRYLNGAAPVVYGIPVYLGD